MALIAKRRGSRGDVGTSLVEMMVVIVVFGLIMSVITAGTIMMLKSQQRQSAVGSDLDWSRKVIETLDRQVRYANAIITPGTGTDGNFYVEWRTGNLGQQQTCTQWRYVASASRIDSRTWLPPIAGNASVTPTAWLPLAYNIKQSGATPIWSITPTASAGREELTMKFTAVSGSTPVTDTSQVTITAINSTSSVAPTGLCTEVGRP